MSLSMLTVTPEELAAAANYLKDTLGKEGVQELISNLSKGTCQFLILFEIRKIHALTVDLWFLLELLWKIFTNKLTLLRIWLK
ncbi:hypothetical protein A4A49_42715 [Nicotiana attenuata]|uniref:Uncharacterized protein n=1 Tax=Nicotiana attenuata TaxID=49451 RepID=A0A314KQN0_NICAT|nr:hypothetical protein A4A49_42715 [Nicotiana attenuata]